MAKQAYINRISGRGAYNESGMLTSTGWKMRGTHSIDKGSFLNIGTTSAGYVDMAADSTGKSIGISENYYKNTGADGANPTGDFSKDIVALTNIGIGGVVVCGQSAHQRLVGKCFFIVNKNSVVTAGDSSANPGGYFTAVDTAGSAGTGTMKVMVLGAAAMRGFGAI